MIWIGIVATLLMTWYAGYLFRCHYYFERLPEVAPTDPAGNNHLKSKEAQIQDPAEEVLQLLPTVTIIVPARNEAANIATCLQAIFAQQYPTDRFEVILVNDHSEDETREIALAIGQGQSNFQIIDLEEKQGVAYKKAAVAKGISQAKGEIILVTDADCQMGPEWCATMAAAFSPTTGMVSGPVLLDSNSPFEDFQALEFMGLIAVGAGSIGAGTPNMCNGANLAYRKQVFEEVGGFSGIDQIASGDDELLMHKIADQTEWEIGFAKDPRAVVRTDALPTWQAFKAQRLRWVSKSTHYEKSSITWIMVISYLAILGLPILFLLAPFFPVLWPFLVINFSLKVLAEATILRAAAIFFDKLALLRWLIPEQIAHVAYVLWVGIAGNRKSYTWKGRTVK